MFVYQETAISILKNTLICGKTQTCVVSAVYMEITTDIWYLAHMFGNFQVD